MKFAFPQDPTHAVSAMRRIDEAADTQSGQSNLERQQDLAVVGQTVPLIFCNRHEWGTDALGQELGVNGGLWYSPRLIGLYPKALLANLLFLVGQGRYEGLSEENVYYGYKPLSEMTSEDYIINEDGTVQVDEDGNPLTQLVEPYFNYAYEAIPAGIDSVYQPGGSDELHIPNIRPREEFKMNGYSFTTNDNCERLQILIDGDLWSEINGRIVADPTRAETYSQSASSYCGYSPPNHTCGVGAPGAAHGYTQTGSSGISCSASGCGMVGFQRKCHITCRQTFFYTAGSWWGDQGPSVVVQFYTYAKYSVKVFESNASAEDLPLYSNEFTLRLGASPFAVPPIDLEPATYRVEIEKIEDGWDSEIVYKPVENGPDQDEQVWDIADERQSYTEAGKSPGRGQMLAEIQVTETIYSKIEYPEIPGGGEQTTGTFFDLTLAGIRGSIRALKPVDGSGPDFWVQTHLFVEQGVICKRLKPEYFDGADEEGSSHYLSDLIYYLLDKAQMIKEAQIDVEALRAACVVHNKYKMHYNGVLQTTMSFTEWLTRVAPYFLMTPRQVDGKYGIAPVVPVEVDGSFSRQSVNSYLQMTITSDDIVAGSYERTYFPARDRRDICLVMVYKDQPVGSPGQTVTIEVRYRGTAQKGPFEQHDLTDFCCHPNQALMSARYLLARRRYTTHACSLNIGRKGAQLKPGDVIAVDLSVTTTEGEGVTDLIYYQVEAVTEEQAGLINLDLVHFPTMTNDAGETVSVISKEIYEAQVSVQ